MKSDPTQTTLHDFQAVFKAAQGAELGTLLVGGHAANFWAGLILPEEPELQQFSPFTSKDLDLLGSKDDLLKLARALHAQAKEMRRGAATPVIGVIQFTTAAGLATQIEVLFSLRGTDPTEVAQSAARVFSPDLDLTVKVPSPLVCLKAKTSNVVDLPQDTRQDVKHVRMLKLCNRALLRRALISLRDGQLSDRAVINALEAVFKFTRSSIALRARQRVPFDWSRCFPFPELISSENAKVANFVQHRLRREFSAECEIAKPE